MIRLRPTGLKVYEDTPMKSTPQRHLRLLSICTAALLGIWSGCAQVTREPQPLPAMVRVPIASYPVFTDDLEYEGLDFSISQSLVYLRKIPPGRPLAFGDDAYPAAHVVRSLEVFQDLIQTRPSPETLNQLIRSRFIVYRSTGRDRAGEVLYTGYYEPVLTGSSEKSPEYPNPIFACPRDLLTIDLTAFSEKFEGEQLIGRLEDQKVVPYYDREDIDYRGVLSDTAQPLVWVKDSVDVFFLQIQGSGKVYVTNGDVVHVHYHMSNGRPYRSIGQLLIDEGKIPAAEMSMQAIRDYLKMHPEEIRRVLSYNPSYIFFKLEKDGPLGALETKLTPGRSIALDRRIFPPAALAYIVTQKPLISSAGQIDSWTACARFTLNQDTGGAIRGPGRADLFWGGGPYAEIAAGYMKHPGQLFFLILKPNMIS
jgi:membrane-bound lytic murein transglycosylase A